MRGLKKIKEGPYTYIFLFSESERYNLMKETYERGHKLATLAIESLPQLDCKAQRGIGERGQLLADYRVLSFPQYPLSFIFCGLFFFPSGTFFCFLLAFCFFHAGDESLFLLAPR